MDAVYSITDLAKHQTAVKSAAEKQVVRITERGRGAYVFCSEAVFEQQLEQAAERARYEERMESLVEQGLLDIEEGRCFRGTAAAQAEVERRMADRA